MPEPTGTPSWHVTIPSDAAEVVPDQIAATNELVTRFLDLNQGYAESAIDRALQSINQLANAGFPVALPEPPTVGVADVGVPGNTIFINPIPPQLGTVVTEYVEPFSIDDVVIPDISSEIPEYTALVQALAIPDAPTLVLPGAIEPPGLDLTFNTPDAPVKDYGAAPDLYAINIPAYESPTLPLFNEEAPEFDTPPPSPFIQWTEPVYSSDVRDAVKAVLVSMLAGGTGLAPAIEQAIWERERVREDVAALSRKVTTIDEWSARGYELPPGELRRLTDAINDESQIKVNGRSRDIAIEQAKLEQANRQFAVEKGLMYEQIFVGLFMAIVDRNFQIAKFHVETQIQIFNSEVTAFNVRQAIFAQKIELYRVRLEVALAGLKVFMALVEAEKAKAEVNVSLVAAFEAKVKAYSAQVDAYGKLVEAEKTRIDAQKSKVDIFRAQIESRVADINGQRAVFEAYSSRVAAESAKAGLEESNARVFTARVAALSTKAEIYFKQADGKIATNRQRLDWNLANMQRVNTWNGQQLSLVQARLAGYQAALALSTSQTENERAGKSLTATIQIERAKIDIAKLGVLTSQWEASARQILAAAQIQAESIRAGGTMATNIASGALAGTHVSAGISAGASSSQSLSNNLSQTFSFGQSTSDSVSVSYTYPHKPV